MAKQTAKTTAPKKTVAKKTAAKPATKKQQQKKWLHRLLNIHHAAVNTNVAANVTMANLSRNWYCL